MTTSLRDRQRQHEQFRRYAATRDPALRDALVRDLLPLARHISRRFSGRLAGEDDLFQVASMGLLKAIDRFDPSMGTAFSTYAVPTIAGEIRRHLRDHTWSVRPPRDVQESSLRVRRAADEFAARHGRVPTAREIAEELEISLESVVEALEGLAARTTLSLDRPTDADDGAAATLGQTFGAPDPALARVEDAVTVEHMLADLPPREREILRLRFEEDLTQLEIGRRVGVSQMHVSRILRDVLRELSEAASPETALV
jgi:RNA polymerase sigma-B factor